MKGMSLRLDAGVVGLVLLVMILLLAGCSEDIAKEETAESRELPISQVVDPEFRSLLPEEAEAFLEREPSALVVDVRTSEERNHVRIPGSRGVVFESILNGMADLPTDRPILLVCAIGGRSYAAGLVLAEAGYSRLYNLRGGIGAWEQAGLPVEHGDAGQPGER